MTAPLSLYNIPAAYPFLDSFAHGLLAEYANDPAAFQSLKILLPTRRTCRNLRNAFLRINDGAPFILPNLIPVGDLDEDELKLHVRENLAHFKTPQWISFVNDLPKTATGKVQKFVLRDGKAAISTQ